jgi:hypothetical protein
MDALQTKLDASNAWEVDRTIERAMDALRCPPGDAKAGTDAERSPRRQTQFELSIYAVQHPAFRALRPPDRGSKMDASYYFDLSWPNLGQIEKMTVSGQQAANSGC